jgi:hypothetical protein
MDDGFDVLCRNGLLAIGYVYHHDLQSPPSGVQSAITVTVSPGALVIKTSSLRWLNVQLLA